jgi:uncharacterized protein
VRFVRDGNSIFARFDIGDSYPGSFVALARDAGITGASLTAIGAVRDTELAYFDLDRREYQTFGVPGVVELVTCMGNVAVLDGEPFFHVHATVGNSDGRITGGHLLKFTVAVSVECRLDLLATGLRRARDERTSLNLLDLP